MTVSDRARRLMMMNRDRAKNRQQSLLSRSAAEAGLSTSDIHYWGHIQGKLQPTFRTDYDRSSVTMS